MKKNLSIALGVALIAVGLVSYSASAKITPKAETLVNLKKEFQAAEQELKAIKDSKVSEQRGFQLKEKSVEIGKLEKELNPNPEKELEEAIAGLETALEMSEKKYSKVIVDPGALEIVKEKQNMLMELKNNKEAKTKSVEQLMADLIEIRNK